MFSQLPASLGVSYHTVNWYVDILEQAFLVRKLAPYFANVGKRLVKSPKVYFRDSGLLHYFLGIRSARHSLGRGVTAVFARSLLGRRPSLANL